MKKLIGISVLSTMLILGQPFMALADTTGSKVINFEDVKSIIAEQNVDVQINKNSSLKDKVDFTGLSKTIRDLEDEIDNINNQRAQGGIPAEVIGGLVAGKSALLDALKQAERGQVDRPTLEAMIDLKNTMSDDTIFRSAEGIFINYNKLNSGISTLTTNIENLQKKLTAMRLQESLGMISHNNINDLETSLVDLQTQLESTKFQKDYLERQFKNLINDQEDTFEIGSIPSTNEDFVIADKEADLEKALKNNYSIRLLELQITIDQSALDRAKSDKGGSSKDYKKAYYDITNANLKLAQAKDSLTSGYYSMIDNIAKAQNDFRLAQQTLADKKVALSEAQMRKDLGMISQLDLDQATTNYQAQEDSVNTKQIDLFNAESNYEWFLKGMPQS